MAAKEKFSTEKKKKKRRGGGWGSLIPEGQPGLPHLFSRLAGNSPAGTTRTHAAQFLHHCVKNGTT